MRRIHWPSTVSSLDFSGLAVRRQHPNRRRFPWSTPALVGHIPSLRLTREGRRRPPVMAPTVVVMKSSLSAGAVALAIGMLTSVTLAGCGSDETPASSEKPATPAVCSSVNSLSSSAGDLMDVQVEKGALVTLQDGLTKVQADATQVVSDAKSEYANEVEAVEAAIATVAASLNAATTTPSAQTLTTVRTAVQTLGTSLSALDDAVRSTC